MKEPTAARAHRVPRSRVDDFYLGGRAGETLPAVTHGTGTVVSLELDTITVQIGDDTISGVIILGADPAVGDEVEVETRGDLLVIPDVFAEGISAAGMHIVSDEDPGDPPPVVVNIGGTNDLDAWSFEPVESPGWSRDLGDPAGIRVQRDSTTAGVTAVGVLWNAAAWPVEAGETVDLAAVASRLALRGVLAEPVLLLSGEAQPVPVVGVDAVLVGSSATLVDTADEAITRAWTIPASIAPTSGTVAPTWARLGLRLTVDAWIGTPTGPLDVDMLLVDAVLTVAGGSWPLGALWLDPSAVEDRPVTVGGVAYLITTTALPGVTSFTRCPVFRKAVVTAPADVGGIVVVFATGATAGVATGATLEFRLGTTAVAAIQTSTIRVTQQVTTAAQPFTVMGSVELAPGEQAEVYVEYQYTNTPTGNADIRSTSIMPLFLPDAVRSAGATKAPISYWDSDSWRDHDLTGATLDVTQAGTTLPAAKTPTTTVVNKTPATLELGEAVTLTATVTPSAAAGSITWYRATTSSGPWTSLGSTAVAGGATATRTWTPSSAGSKWFKAAYSGSTTHAASSDVTDTVCTVGTAERTVTETFHADWVQGYGQSGSQLSGTGHDTSVHQGYVGASAGNRKSLVGFGDLGLPGDADPTKVELVCMDWEKWAKGGKGTLIVGWHSQTTKPGSYAIGSGEQDMSRHAGRPEGGWTIPLGNWAENAVTLPGFRGIAIGPGLNNSDEYQGYSAGGPGQWRLKVTYTTRT